MRDQVDGLGRTPGKYDFLGRRCIDKRRKPDTGLLISLGSLLAQGMHTPMNVGIVLAIKITDSVDDLLWSLRRCRSIKVNQWLAVYTALQNGKVRANLLQVQAGFDSHRSRGTHLLSWPVA